MTVAHLIIMAQHAIHSVTAIGQGLPDVWMEPREMEPASVKLITMELLVLTVLKASGGLPVLLVTVHASTEFVILARKVMGYVNREVALQDGKVLFVPNVKITDSGLSARIAHASMENVTKELRVMVHAQSVISTLLGKTVMLVSKTNMDLNAPALVNVIHQVPTVATTA